ncbi:MAG: hypothetical protein IPM69_11605 [Ignavibacteria bacterium]|nr:hypothetical protein [Ignavibacteria bacterium]
MCSLKLLQLYSMQTVAAKDISTHFMEILFQVQKGEQVAISIGDDNNPVALLIPYQIASNSKRNLGVLEGKMDVQFSDDLDMSIDAFIGEKE